MAAPIIFLWIIGAGFLTFTGGYDAGTQGIHVPIVTEIVENNHANQEK